MILREIKEQEVERVNKKCSICHIQYENTSEFFQKCAQKKDGLRPECKSCSKNRKKTKAYFEYLENKKKERASVRIEYFSSEEYKVMMTESKQKNIERKRKWALKNKDILREREAERRKLGKVKPVSKEKRKEYKKRQYKKIKSDPYLKMISLARGRMRCFVKKEAKKFKIKDMLIFNSDEFKQNIESKFKDGMTWDNYGRKGWHIDHIKPISKFNLNDIEECRHCWSLDNLQPLWWHENLSKSNKIFK
jgi:hypothetical protein